MSGRYEPRHASGNVLWPVTLRDSHEPAHDGQLIGQAVDQASLAHTPLPGSDQTEAGGEQE